MRRCATGEYLESIEYLPGTGASLFPLLRGLFVRFLGELWGVFTTSLILLFSQFLAKNNKSARKGDVAAHAWHTQNGCTHLVVYLSAVSLPADRDPLVEAHQLHYSPVKGLHLIF